MSKKKTNTHTQFISNVENVKSYTTDKVLKLNNFLTNGTYCAGIKSFVKEFKVVKTTLGKITLQQKKGNGFATLDFTQTFNFMNYKTLTLQDITGVELITVQTHSKKINCILNKSDLNIIYKLFCATGSTSLKLFTSFMHKNELYFNNYSTMVVDGEQNLVENPIKKQKKDPVITQIAFEPLIEGGGNQTALLNEGGNSDGNQTDLLIGSGNSDGNQTAFEPLIEGDGNQTALKSLTEGGGNQTALLIEDETKTSTVQTTFMNSTESQTASKLLIDGDLSITSTYTPKPLTYQENKNKRKNNFKEKEQKKKSNSTWWNNVFNNCTFVKSKLKF